MAFSWETGTSAQTPTTPKSATGFSWQQPTPSTKVLQLQNEAQNAKQASDQANSFGTIVKETATGAINKITDPLVEFAHSLWGTYQQTPTKLAEDIKAGSSDIQQGNVLKGIAKAGVRTAGDAAIAIFAPISSAIGAVLNATGGQQLQDKAGQVIADKSGITDLPAFQKFAMDHPNASEDFNRILTLFLAKGEKGQIDPVKIANDAKTFVTKIINDAQTTQVPVKSLSPAESKVNISTPATRYQEYLKSQGYEPYTPPDQLPTIQMGAKASSELPTIQIGEKTPSTKMGSLTVEPIKTNFSWNKSTEIKPSIPDTQIKPSIPDTQLKPSGLSETLKSNAIAKGLEGDLGQSPVYEVRPLAPVIQQASDFVVSNPDLALKVARGEVSPPDGLLHSEVTAALARKAYIENDATMIHKLATDEKITSLATESGRVVKGYDTNITNDPVAALKEVAQAREQGASVRQSNLFKKTSAPEVKRQTVDRAMAEFTKQTKAPKQTWVQFIKDLQC